MLIRCSNLLAHRGCVCLCHFQMISEKSPTVHKNTSSVSLTPLSSQESKLLSLRSCLKPKPKSVTHTCHQGTKKKNQAIKHQSMTTTKVGCTTHNKFHSPIPVFIFICVREELRTSQREVQSGEGQISVAKTDQLHWTS